MYQHIKINSNAMFLKLEHFRNNFEFDKMCIIMLQILQLQRINLTDNSILSIVDQRIL